jgi:hypothetical protein
MDNLDGDIKKLNSAYSDLKIGLQEAADEGLRDFTQEMTKFFNMLTKNLDTVLKYGKAIALLIASLAGARLLGPIIGATVTGVIALSNALGPLRLGMLGAQTAMLGTIGTLGALKGAFALLGGPAGVILFAVGAIATWISTMGDAEIATDEYKSSVEGLRTSLKNFSEEKIAVVIDEQRSSLKTLGNDLEDVQSKLKRALQTQDRKRRGGADAASGAAQRNLQEIRKLRLQEQEIVGAIADGEALIGELQSRRIQLATGKEMTLDEEKEAMNKLADAADELGMRARQAMSGLFPEREEIQKLRDAQKEIETIQKLLAQSPPEVVADLNRRGITTESLAEAHAKLESNIAKVGKKANEVSDTMKTYNSEMENLSRALAQAEIAAQGNGKATAKQRIEFELAEGKLKDLTDATKRKALVDKAAAIDAARLTASITQQTMELQRANDLATLAAGNETGELTRVQAVQYELAHGALKDFNDEKQKAALIDEAARADTLALNKSLEAQADAVKDQLDPLREYNREIEKLSELQKAGKLTQEEYTEAARAAALQHNEAAQIIRSEFGTVFADVIDGTKSMSDAFRDMAGNIINSLNDLAAKKIGEQLFDTLFTPGAAEKGSMGILDLFSGAAGSGATAVQAASSPAGGAAESIAAAVSTAQPLPVQGVVGGAGSILGDLAGGDAANDPQVAAAEQTQAQISSGFTDVFAKIKTGAGSVWDSVSNGFGEIMGNIGDGFSGLWKGIQGLFSSGGAGGGGGMLGNLAGAAIQSFSGAAHGGTFTAKDLMTFAQGGDFRVGGAGGIDSQVVAFRASPNETVTVARPQDAQKNKSINVTNNFTIQAPNGNVSESSQQQIAGRVQQSIALAQRRTL